MARRVQAMQMPVQLAAMLVSAAASIPFALCLAIATGPVIAWRAITLLLRQSS